MSTYNPLSLDQLKTLSDNTILRSMPLEWRPYYPGKAFLKDECKFYVDSNFYYNLNTQQLESK